MRDGWYWGCLLNENDEKNDKVLILIIKDINIIDYLYDVDCWMIEIKVYWLFVF